MSAVLFTFVKTSVKSEHRVADIASQVYVEGKHAFSLRRSRTSILLLLSQYPYGFRMSIPGAQDELVTCNPFDCSGPLNPATNVSHFALPSTGQKRKHHEVENTPNIWEPFRIRVCIVT